MIPPFELHRPTTIDEASALAAQHGDGARFYAGGTELLLVLREGFLDARHLIDLKRIPGLSGVHIDAGSTLCIGATTVHTDVERSDLVLGHFPALAGLASRIANVRVRNTGTLGGNLCFGEPHGDPAALLVAAEAELTVSGPEGIRTITMDGWMAGPFEVDLRPGEILTEIRIPLPAAATGYAYHRFRSLERPTASVAARVDISADGSIGVSRLVAACAGPRPERLPRAEQALVGAPVADADRLSITVAEIAAEEADVSEDAYGPVGHKRQLIGVLTRRAVLDAIAQADEGLRR